MAVNDMSHHSRGDTSFEAFYEGLVQAAKEEEETMSGGNVGWQHKL